MQTRPNPEYWKNGRIPWISSGKVNDYVVRDPSDLISEVAQRDCGLALIPKGSLILGMVGQGKTRGMSAQLAIDTTINQNLAAIVPYNGLNSRFLHQVLVASYQDIRELGRGGNQEALNCEIIARFRIPLPPTPEQESIVEDLNSKLRELSAAEQYAMRELTLLREYRTRLIADLVTGKLDVRAAAATLPAMEFDQDVIDDGEADVGEDEEGDEIFGGDEGEISAE